MAPCLVCSGTKDEISPAVVAGVGVDAVGFSAQVPVSTISGFSFPGVFFLGVVRQCSSCGQEAHVTCPFPFSLLNTVVGIRTLREKANYILATFELPWGSLISNGKVRSQECLKDYPSDILQSTSTFQEWNGTTVMLWKRLSLSVCGKPPSFFPLSLMPWNR